jgi:hypothetical protein
MSALSSFLEDLSAGWRAMVLIRKLSVLVTPEALGFV